MLRQAHSVHDLLDIHESLSAVPHDHHPYESRALNLHLSDVDQWFVHVDLEFVQSINHAHPLIDLPIDQTDVLHRPWPKGEIRQRFFARYKSQPNWLCLHHSIATHLPKPH